MSPVPEKFQAYGEAVCAFLSHATRREKAAVRQELMDHLTDHTQALLDAGCPPEAVVHKEFIYFGRSRFLLSAIFFTTIFMQAVSYNTCMLTLDCFYPSCISNTRFVGYQFRFLHLLTKE